MAIRNVVSFIFCVLMLNRCLFLTSYGDSTSETKIDAVIAVDVSGSMNESDVHNVSYEAMKMFIDMASVKGDKIGVIAYTDQIIREKALLQIRSTEDKTDLKTFIDQLSRGSYTDIGLGLSEAVKVLDSGRTESHVPMIIILTDGNTSLRKGASVKDSQKLLDDAVSAAQHKGYPIYAIGLNADGKLNTDVLSAIAEATGGKLFETSTAEKLPQILSEIYASHLKLKVVSLSQFVGDGTYQEVRVNVPNTSVQEANISVLSPKAVELRLTNPVGSEVTIPSEKALISRSRAYSLLKLLQPEQGDWILKVKGADKQKITINLVYNYDLGLAMEPLASNEISPGDLLPIKAYFKSGGVRVEDPGLYQGSSAKLVVTDPTTGTSTEHPLSINDQEITGEWRATEGNQDLRIVVTGNNLYRESEPIQVHVEARVTQSTTPAAVPAMTGQAAAPEKARSFPWLPVILGVLGIVIVTLIVLFLMKRIKAQNRKFFGYMLVEVRDDQTGVSGDEQTKRLDVYTGKFTVRDLIGHEQTLDTADKISVVPGQGTSLKLINKSDGKIKRAGHELDASKGQELRMNDRITIVFPSIKKSISMKYIK